MVRINGNGQLVPSCATLAAEGMQVESETKAVRQVRRTALELLLSDHLGDCMAPCQFGCPAQMDIPTMLRQIVAGQWREAIATVKRDIALPAILGRICPAPCEKVCRRGDLDGAVSICLLEAAGGRRRSGVAPTLHARVQAADGQARGDCRRGPDGLIGCLLP